MNTSRIVIGLVTTTMLALSGCGTTIGVYPSANSIVKMGDVVKAAYAPSLSHLNHDDYLYAVAAIDQFLSDWLNGNSKRGIALLTPHAKNGSTAHELRAYFSAASGPRHEGYEIVGYKENSHNRFEFRVWMYGYAMGLYGPGASWSRPRPQTVTVVHQNGAWYIDNLPQY